MCSFSLLVLCYSVDDVAVLVNHRQTQLLLVSGQYGETFGWAAEHCSLYRLNLSCERSRRINYIIDVVALHIYVLEVVDMSANVHCHIIILVEQWHHTFLHVYTFVDALACLCIDRMMAYYYYPIFLSSLKSLVEPRQLLLHILLAGIWVFFGCLAILVNERSGIKEHNTNACAFVIVYLGIIL